MRKAISVFVIALSAACTNGSNSLLGTVYLKHQLVRASEGGTIEVTAADSASLAGTRIAIPPRALAADTDIGITAGSTDITIGSARLVGPVVDFGPDGTRFLLPARVTQPITAASFGALQVHRREAGGQTSILEDASLTVDATARLASFDVIGFTEYQLGSEDCAGDADCVGSDACMIRTCEEGVCVFTPIACDDGDPCTMDVCDVTVGCLHEAASDGTACDDGNSCTTDDACSAGVCAGTTVDGCSIP